DAAEGCIRSVEHAYSKDGGLTVSVLLGGSLVVEAAFSYPGLGTALNSAVQVRDLPVVQAVVLVVAAGVVTVNLLADLATVLLTPQLRTGSGASA
ncbi:ABC transporter permease subunit, partial [Streptomyces sp. NPDC005921]